MSQRKTSEPVSELSPPLIVGGKRRPSRLLEITLLILVPLAALAISHRFAPTQPRVERELRVPASFTRDDEAARLSEIRRAVERDPEHLDAAVARLRDFIVTANDASLMRRAIAWKNALTLEEEKTYRVRLKRFQLSGEAYRSAFRESLEPGDPDVYLQVRRTREGREELVYDGREFALEGWSGEWESVAPPEGQSGGFSFSWRQGEPIRVSLVERDLMGDNTIADYVVESGLAILLVSSPRISAEGHIVELESDFAFGK